MYLHLYLFNVMDMHISPPNGHTVFGRKPLLAFSTTMYVYSRQAMIASNLLTDAIRCFFCAILAARFLCVLVFMQNYKSLA